MLFGSWTVPDGGRQAPHPLLRVRIIELNEELRKRQPELRDIERIIWILGELDKAGLVECLGEVPNRAGGIVGHLALILGITPGMLWITVVLLALVAGKPFFDFVAQILPFVGS